MQENTITRKNIRTMLDRFYSAVLKDDLIANYFIDRLGDEMISDEWQNHLSVLINFWASVTLNDKSYKRDALKPHLDMDGLDEKSFQRWLELFDECVERLYTKEIADIFKAHGRNISNNFMKSILPQS
jgi:hemoglobin